MRRFGNVYIGDSLGLNVDAPEMLAALLGRSREEIAALLKQQPDDADPISLERARQRRRALQVLATAGDSQNAGS